MLVHKRRYNQTVPKVIIFT